MFGNQAFHTWSVTLVGAALFAMLFMVLGMMTELLFEGAFRMTQGVKAFGLAAFVSYVGVAVFLRRSKAPPDA